MHRILVLVPAAFALAVLPLRADRVVKQDGSAIDGEVVGLRDGQVQMKVGGGALALPLSQVKTVEMAPPDALAETQSAAPERVVAVLAPLVESYRGLPAPWMSEAMSRLSDAYAAQDDFEKSNAVLAEMKKLYGDAGGRVSLPAQIGAARNALKQGHPDEVLSLLQPVVDQAGKTLLAFPAERGLLGSAFVIYGQAQEAKGDAPGALVSYFSTIALYPGNEAAVKTAQERADALRAAHPGLAVP